MSISKIQTGDAVQVIAGKYKGSKGTVTNVYNLKKRNGSIHKRVIVAGLPLQTAYQKGYKAAQMPGQMYTVERSVDASNVSLVSGSSFSKVKIEDKAGVKYRVLKKDGKTVLKTKIEKKSVDAASPAKDDKTKKVRKSTKK